jgi:hypothetical protein
VRSNATGSPCGGYNHFSGEIAEFTAYIWVIVYDAAQERAYWLCAAARIQFDGRGIIDAADFEELLKAPAA